MSEANQPGLALTRLTLSQFRSYAQLSWRPEARLTAIFGPNGSGKTNFLEAISLLLPGRGLRGARTAELVRHGAVSWGVAGRFVTPDGACEIGTGTPPDGALDRRVFRLDGAAPRNQSEIGGRIAAIWLTPQMDRLFQEGASGRRRFLDRLVFALEPGHAREVAAFEAAMAQRNRLLSDGHADPAWLAGLEDAMARHAVAVSAARAALVARLNAALMGGIAGRFPAARLGLAGAIAERLQNTPAVDVEEWLRAGLADGRRRDASAGAAGLGAHRADMTLADAATGLAAQTASTGQQKALLIGVVLGHAAVLAQARGFAPLLLLDEPAVHLDAERRTALFAALAALPAQVFLTGTDAEVFRPLDGLAAFLRTGGDGLAPADATGGRAG